MISPIQTCEVGELRQPRRGIPSLKYAMGVLQRELDNAANFYQEFKQGYDDETRPLASYMSKDKLDDIWVQRVKGKCAEDDESDITNSSEAPRTAFSMRFVDTKRSLNRATTEFIQSIIHARERAASNSHVQVDPARHFQEKVTLALRQTQELMGWAMSSSDGCAALYRELTSLKELLNPESEGLKELYKSRSLDDGN